MRVNTRKTLKTETFQAKGENEVLIRLDDLARKIRRDLGESLKEINRDIVALPEATTPSLEALKCLVKGNEAWSKDRKLDEAEALFLKAIELDPNLLMPMPLWDHCITGKTTGLKGGTFYKSFKPGRKAYGKRKVMDTGRSRGI